MQSEKKNSPTMSCAKITEIRFSDKSEKYGYWFRGEVTVSAAFSNGVAIRRPTMVSDSMWENVVKDRFHFCWDSRSWNDPIWMFTRGTLESRHQCGVKHIEMLKMRLESRGFHCTQHHDKRLDTTSVNFISPSDREIYIVFSKMPHTSGTIIYCIEIEQSVDAPTNENTDSLDCTKVKHEHLLHIFKKALPFLRSFKRDEIKTFKLDTVENDLKVSWPAKVANYFQSWFIWQ